MSEPGTFEEIPASKIETCNPVCDFSPIKFSVSGEAEEISVNGPVDVDEEITFGMMARKTGSKDSEDNHCTSNCTESTVNVSSEERLHRRSEEDICNTPKRERHEDQKLNIRSARLLEMDDELSAENSTDDLINLKTTPSKKKNGEMVKSLSIEFEQRLASIHVSPRPATTKDISPQVSASKPVRSMSPIRSVAQLSPVSKLNLNDYESSEDSCVIETPKLVSPSKIAGAAPAVVDVEKIKSELEAMVKN